MVGLAIVAMIAAGWRKPARASARTPRARGPFRAIVGTQVEELKTPLAKRTPWWKRLYAIVMIPIVGVVLGAVTATVFGFGAAYLLITLSDMLKR